MRRGVQVLLDSDQVDGVLLTGYFGGYADWQSDLAAPELAAAHEIAGVVAAQRKPLVVQTVDPESPASRVLRAAGVPVHRDVDRAAARCWPGLVDTPTAGLAGELPAAGSAGHRHVVPGGPGAVRAGRDRASPSPRTVTDAAGLEAALASRG